MYIKKLQIHGVRNLEDVFVTPNQKTNIFTGKNASGKTSFLEAIHILARSKSFRTPKLREVINQKKEKLVVIAEIAHEKNSTIRLRVEKGTRESTLSLNGENLKSVSELAKTLPIISITQDSQQLITGPPKQRRHWLDWAMFHVEPRYLANWKQYFRALRQRNMLLKKKQRNEDLYRAWEREMVKLAKEITEQRRLFLGQVSEQINRYFVDEDTKDTEVVFKQGWPEEIEFEDCLIKQREQDKEKGYTRSGPHQADIKFLARGVEIKKVFSRGQIKLFVNQMLMSQAGVTQKRSRISPIILMDDYTAELDKNNSNHLLFYIKKQQFQSFITTTEEVEEAKETAVFHVEQGKIIENTRQNL